MAIIIVSFILMAAYVTANKNNLINQDTQERSQALQLANSQIESLHVNAIGANNCFDRNGNPVGTAGDNTPCMVNADGTKDTTHKLPEFTLAVTKVGGGACTTGSTCKVSVTWAGVASNTQANITLYYQP